MTSVLYDVPGPRARRRNLIGTILGGLVLLLILFLLYRKLDAQGIFDAERWDVFSYGVVWEALGRGLLATLKVAGVAALLACVLGGLVAGLRLSQRVWVRGIARVYVELFRGLPVLLLMFFPTVIYTSIDKFYAAVIGLTLYNSAVIAEILRSGVGTLPRGQREAAYAVGLTPWRSLGSIELPQAVRIMLPALISQLVVLLKDTSLAFIILYPELLRRIQLLQQYYGSKYLFSFFFVGAGIYILTNFAISMIANRIAARGSKKAAR